MTKAQANQVFHFRVLIDRQLETRDGECILLDGLGLCFDFDANALDRFAVDSWV
jgi:hypothetical protein